MGGTESLRKKEGSKLSLPSGLAGIVVTRRSQDVLFLDCEILHEVSLMAAADVHGNRHGKRQTTRSKYGSHH